MPRVSDQYRANRRSEIVAAAARLFAANGFHATSMADIIGESRLSAGAVYRYFRSKEELIAAVAQTTLAAADETFGALLADGAAPTPGDAVSTMVRVITERMAGEPATGVDMTRIGVQVWAEALRNPELAAHADEAYRRLRGHFAEVARRSQAAGQLSAEVTAEQAGAAMLGLVQGFILQRLLLGDTDPGGYAAGARALLSATPGVTRG